jgi:hypothetical protein
MKPCWFRVSASLVFFSFGLCGWLCAQTNPPVNRPPAKTVGAVDLNGIWDLVPNTAAGQKPGDHIRMLVFQLKNSIQFYDLEGLPFSKPGSQVLTATEPLPSSLPGAIKGLFRWSNPKGRMQWWYVTIDLDDASHLRVLGINRYAQKETREVREMPCNLQNPQHMDGAEAFYRGNAHVLMNDSVAAACWFHVGAIEGHPIAQARYADSLLRGIGVTKNLEEARVWAQKSADQHNPYGEGELAAILSSAAPHPSSLAEVVVGVGGCCKPTNG